MRIVGTLTFAGAAITAAAIWSAPALTASRSQDTGPVLATPPGITLQAIASGGGRRGEGGSREEEKKPSWSVDGKADPFFPAAQTRSGGRGTTYADGNGHTLYTYDKDTQAGVSACYDDCAKAWPPALVPAGFKPTGAWSSITRTDGSKQWTFKGKPLYTFTKDTNAGQRNGEGAGGGAWRNAKFEPTAGLEIPFGMSLTESLTANGYVLSDENRLTIYMSDEAPARAKAACAMSACENRWTPVTAAQLANPTGDFTLLPRGDGFKQWAFKGKALYTYSGDEIPGDSNGVGVDKKYKIAMIVEYFVPKTASIRDDIARGPLVATAAGMTLYRRDTSFHQSNGHGLPKSTPGNQSVGRAMGTRSCDEVCLKTWKPFLASSNDQPSGYWDIYVRADGNRQWAYKGFALYTYPGDKKPGDKNGSDIYDVLIADRPDQDIYKNGPVNNPSMAAMFWSYVEP